MEVLRHEEEALLALLGVQAGHPIRHETVLVDVGGGSSEILVVAPGLDAIAVGLPLGAARLSRSLVRTDPPSRADLETLVDEARSVLKAAPDAEAKELVAVGGTASNLLRIGPPLARRVLTVRRIESALELLASSPSETISAQFGVKPSRARVLPSGAAILLAVARALRSRSDPRLRRRAARGSCPGIRPRGVQLADGACLAGPRLDALARPGRFRPLRSVRSSQRVAPGDAGPPGSS